MEFARLGLVIIDEQHRFGVEQRAQLRAKSLAPHTLYMTATPIPRTLAQTKYADLDVSIIDELPPGRTPVATFVIRDSRKARVYDFVRENVELGHQTYVVVPAIEAGETELSQRDRRSRIHRARGVPGFARRFAARTHAAEGERSRHG